MSAIRRADFPEFRVLLRAVEIFPWTTVAGVLECHSDKSKTAGGKSARRAVDFVVNTARNQVAVAFPVLAFLRFFASLPEMLTPGNYWR